MSQDNTKQIAWFFAGAAIGAAIALLYAPASGEETRKRLGERFDENKDKLAEQGRELMEKGKEFYEQGRKMADDASEIFEKGRKLVQG